MLIFVVGTLDPGFGVLYLLLMPARKTSPAALAFHARASRGYWEVYAMRPDGEWFHSYGDRRASRWTPCADPRRADGTIEPIQDLFTSCGEFCAVSDSDCQTYRLPLNVSYTQEREARRAKNAGRIAALEAQIKELENERAVAPAFLAPLVDAKLRALAVELDSVS